MRRGIDQGMMWDIGTLMFVIGLGESVWIVTFTTDDNSTARSND